MYTRFYFLLFCVIIIVVGFFVWQVVIVMRKLCFCLMFILFFDLIAFAETENRFYYQFLDESQKIYYDYLLTTNLGDDLERPHKITLADDLNVYDGDICLRLAFGAYLFDNPEASAWLVLADCMNSDCSYYLYQRLVNPVTNEIFSIPYPDPYVVSVDLLRNTYVTCESLSVMHDMYDYIADYYKDYSGDRLFQMWSVADFLNKWLEYDYDAVSNGLDMFGHYEVSGDGSDGIIMSGLVFDDKPETDLVSAFCIYDRKATCLGYSRAFKSIADRLGVPCVMLTSDDHAFVAVQLDDGFWYVLEPQGGYMFYGFDYVSVDDTYWPSTFCATGLDAVTTFNWGIPTLGEKSIMMHNRDGVVASNLVANLCDKFGYN